MIEELRRLQLVEVEILKDFDRYCKRHHLRYFLIGGALLGAKRYGKFIPWDDDIDVAMFREDYNKLQETWEREPDPTYFLQSNKSDSLFARGILKLRKNGTQIVERVCQKVNMHDGIYIDIFPIDYADECSGRRMERRGKRVKRLLSLRALKSGYNNGRKQFAKRVVCILIRPLSREWMDAKLDALCTAENNGTRKYAVLYLHNYGWRNQVHPFATFGDGADCLFENHTFTAPADPDAFLKKVFGEHYMKEPELSRQCSPHQYMSVSFQD